MGEFIYEENFNIDSRDYGYHWWIKNYSVNRKLFKTFYAIGHGEQAIIVVPEENLVVVITAGNYLQTERRPFELMAKYILPSITSKENISKPVYKIGTLQKYTGEYCINQNEKIKIFMKDNSLIAADPAGASFKLIPISMNYFAIDNPPREVLFIPDSDNIIAEVEIYVDGQGTDIFPKLK